VQFRILGPVQVVTADGTATLPRRRERCLLAILLLELDQFVSADRLTDLLWNADPPAGARHTLASHVSRVRSLLATVGAADHGVALVSGREGYHITGNPDLVDAHLFRSLVDHATTMARPDRRQSQLRAALDLWRGPPMAGAATDWLRRQLCTDLEERRLAAIEHLAAACLALGQPGDVLPMLAQTAAQNPGHERLVELLMRALHQAGRKAEALDAFMRTRTFLAEELGLDPRAALRDLHQAILRDQLPTATPPAPTPAIPRQLPAVPGFVGRADALNELDELLVDGEGRGEAVVISAIDGTAGVGKTALAAHWAHRVADRFPDGQLFIDLHGYTHGVEPVEPAEVLDRMLRTLGIPGPQIPTSLDERGALYRTRVADQRMLIVLDNAATETQVAPLLPGAPGCLVLVTSRHRLAGLDHTHTLSLDILPTPDAVTLFTRAAAEHNPVGQPPELLTELVELCGRLPLAIRIAAARLRSHPTWNLSHLIERLRDRQHRLAELEAGQRSITAALDLSYQHLSHDQQLTYRRLGLPPGPDIDAYATAALLDLALPHATRKLDELLDAHLLLEPVPGRFRFHDLTRAHAAHTATGERAEPAGREALDRLLDYYQHTASVAMDTAYPYERERRPQFPPARTPSPDLSGPAAALDWLDTELSNLLATANGATERGKAQPILHLSAILHRHLRTRGRYDVAQTLHHQALAAARATGHQAGQLDALTCLGHIYRLQGRNEQAADHFGQALQIARTIENRDGEQYALWGLGRAHRLRGQYELAADHFEQALQIARTIENRDGEQYALWGLGEVHLAQGRYERASTHFRHALQIARTIGNRVSELETLSSLGHILRRQGRYERAGTYFRQALRIARNIGNRHGELQALIGLGDIHLQQHRHKQASDHFHQLLNLAQECGDRNYEFEAWQGLGRLQYATGQPATAINHHDQALAMAGELGQPADQARAHDGLANAYDALNQHERARHHWQRALDILLCLGVDHTDDEEATVAAIRAHLERLSQPRRATVFEAG
jgi:DNA-binding SARP family transcriptional activator/tetratricopeptide (TPR) repeat protein